MLKYCDSFDHCLHPSPESGNFVATSPLGLLGWSTAYAKDLYIEPGKGRWGTNRLNMNYSSNSKSFSIGRSCNTVVVGFAFQRGMTTNTYVNGYPVFEPPSAPQTVSVYNEFTVGFSYGTFENFRVNCKMTTALGPPSSSYVWQQVSGLEFTYTTGTGTGYPAIQGSPYVSVPYLVRQKPYTANYNQADRMELAFTFLEIYIDVTDYKNGTVKVAVNGETVHTLTGIATCAYNGFGDNPADARAKINTVNFGKLTGGGAILFLDSMYVCDDDGGYNNDFLGDIFVKAAYPKGDGSKKDFIPYVNSTQQADDAPRYSIIDDTPFSTANEADYIQGDQDGIQELVSFDSVEIPSESTIIAVNHRTAARSVASVGTPPPNTLVPLFKAIGNDTIITNSLAKKFTGWTYQFLDIYWNLVPGFAVDWTAQYIDDSEFGFMLREPIWTGVELEDITFADEVIDE